MAPDLRLGFALTEELMPLLFATALGPAFATTPAPLRDLHTVVHGRRWEGAATVTRGRSRLAGLVCALIGFPRAEEGVPVSVRMRREGGREVWARTFAGRRFRSVLSLGGRPGRA